MTELRPNPIRSDTSRRETAGAPAGDSGAARLPSCRSWTVVSTIPPHEPCSREKAWGPRSPCMARSREAGSPGGHNAAIRLRGSRRSTRHGRGPAACAARLHPGPRAASPDAPRRAPGSAEPEVPSIDEPPSVAWRAFASLPGFRLASARWAGSSPQVVANLWRAHGAFCSLLRGPTAFDELPAAKARSPLRPKAGPEPASVTHGG
jgi:hypothetical protein